MNRRQRRAQDRVRNSINTICAASRADGTPWTLHGLTGACRDCTATASLTALPDGTVQGDIWHDDGCPAATGITPWQPHPID